MNNKKIFMVVIIIFVIIVIFLFLALGFERIVCEIDGGTWRQFPTTCVDYCTVGDEVQPCSMAITSGCDCGPDKCWTGISCKLNS